MIVAFIDLDGVVCDCTKRFVLAQEAKDKCIAEKYAALDLGFPIQDEDVHRIERDANNVYWQTAFDPQWLPLDQPISGVDYALEQLERDGYRVIYLTSRPDTLRVATLQWLYIHGLDKDIHGFFRELVCCAMAFRSGYIKTIVWKPGIVQTLAHLLVIDTVLFVDDEESNRDAMLAAQSSLFEVEVKSSLLHDDKAEGPF